MAFPEGPQTCLWNKKKGKASLSKTKIQRPAVMQKIDRKTQNVFCFLSVHFPSPPARCGWSQGVTRSGGICQSHNVLWVYLDYPSRMCLDYVTVHILSRCLKHLTWVLLWPEFQLYSEQPHQQGVPKHYEKKKKLQLSYLWSLGVITSYITHF